MLNKLPGRCWCCWSRNQSHQGNKILKLYYLAQDHLGNKSYKQNQVFWFSAIVIQVKSLLMWPPPLPFFSKLTITMIFHIIWIICMEPKKKIICMELFFFSEKPLYGSSVLLKQKTCVNHQTAHQKQRDPQVRRLPVAFFWRLKENPHPPLMVIVLKSGKHRNMKKTFKSPEFY